jgi:hypothetical protein
MPICSATGAQTWESLGLPLPTLAGYTYSVDAGLLRSAVDPYNRAQVRRYTHRPGRARLRWAPVNAAELRELRAVLERFGATWFHLPLVTSESGTGSPWPTRVRLIEPLQMASITWEVWELTAAVELAGLDECQALVDRGSSDYLACVTALPAWYAYSVDWAAIESGWGNEADWGRDN